MKKLRRWEDAKNKYVSNFYFLIFRCSQSKPSAVICDQSFEFGNQNFHFLSHLHTHFFHRLDNQIPREIDERESYYAHFCIKENKQAYSLPKNKQEKKNETKNQQQGESIDPIEKIVKKTRKKIAIFLARNFFDLPTSPSCQKFYFWLPLDTLFSKIF